MGKFLIIDRFFTLTNSIIVLTIVGFVIQHSIEYGSLIFGLNMLFWTNNLYYQLLSTIFTHGGVFHIVMNMFVLYQFGNLIEKYRGKITFLILSSPYSE